MPVPEVDGRPHLVVDGAPRAGTVATLSHWPSTPTPVALRADLSAESARRALVDPQALPEGVGVVTIDHYDVDGVVALAMLCVEGLATDFGDLLVEAARIGDFGVVRRQDAATVAFALEALGRLGHGAARLGADVALSPRATLAESVHAALAMLPALCNAPGELRWLWQDEASAFDASSRALRDGAVDVDDHPDVDVAVVRADLAILDPDACWADEPVHRAALHSATDRLRVVSAFGPHLAVRFRYETWVRMSTRPPLLRVDLTPLAVELSELEPGPATWIFDGAAALTPALRPAHGAPSGIEAGRFIDLVLTRLAQLDAGTAAWDPYAS